MGITPDSWITMEKQQKPWYDGPKHIILLAALLYVPYRCGKAMLGAPSFYNSKRAWGWVILSCVAIRGLFDYYGDRDIESAFYSFGIVFGIAGIVSD